MKKQLIIAACAALSLAACTKVNVETPETITVNGIAANANSAIGFEAVSHKSTKAAINDAIFPTTAGGFKVFASYLATGTWSNTADGKLYIDGATTSYETSSDLWISDPKAYWPLTGTLTFSAVYPSTATVAYSASTTAHTMTVTNYEADGQTELLYSNPLDAKDQTSATATTNYVPESGKTDKTGDENKGVNIVFNHALSQVLVYAKSGVANVKYQVTGLDLKTKDKATLTLTEGSDNKYSVSWGTPSGTATSGNIAFTENIPDVTSADYVKVDNLGTSAGWLVMPQTLAAANADQVLEITYTMYMQVGASTSTTWTEAGSVTKIIPLYLDGKLAAFEAGKKYVLDLIISPKEIKYAPSVAGWTDETIEHYDVQ